ncbi:hypothetical protein H312_01755 [Anncaliia algerae PRA339]|uniref:Uncharacterized protein n=1 Tax=Anncaliia algerae PRA339 TaxID=1288291 RepID=A0A059F1C4_9MICR|nr:hypothetical protein H312_01755 [Anncaliia algerae PRA339]
MKKRCCGMSITLNNDNEIKNLILSGNNLSGVSFYSFIVLILLMVVSLEFFRKFLIKENNYLILSCAIGCFDYLIGWFLMTVCMTANIYFIFTVCVGKIISIALFGRNTNNKCCA